jgi:hypothetical protein
LEKGDLGELTKWANTFNPSVFLLQGRTFNVSHTIFKSLLEKEFREIEKTLPSLLLPSFTKKELVV